MPEVPGAVFRDYRSADIEAMFRLDEICFSEEFRFSRKAMQAFAEARNAVVVVAEGNGGIAGFVIVHVERIGVRRRCGYVVTLDVAEEWRRMGLAHRMMSVVEQRVAAAGAQWMELHVFTGNAGAIRFYERLGYERIGLKRGFYGAANLDAFVYRRELSQL